MCRMCVGLLCIASFLETKAMPVVCHATPGRGGDQIIHVMHALALEHQLGIRYYYTPFNGSDKLVLDDCGRLVSTDGFEKVELKNNADHPVVGDRVLNDFYHFPEGHDEQLVAKQKGQFVFRVNWDDQALLARLRMLIRPKPGVAINWIDPEPGCVNVALHVRRGGTFDCTARAAGTDPHYAGVRVDMLFPSKFPNDTFYTNQVRALRRYFGDRPLSVFIFTDDSRPDLIIGKYAEALKDVAGIQLYCRPLGEKVDWLDDFFSMMRFDVIVRPESSLSMAAAILGRPMVEIWPEDCTYDGQMWANGAVGVAVRDSCTTRLTSWDEIFVADA